MITNGITRVKKKRQKKDGETRNGVKKKLLKKLLTIGESARPLQSITESKPL